MIYKTFNESDIGLFKLNFGLGFTSPCETISSAFPNIANKRRAVTGKTIATSMTPSMTHTWIYHAYGSCSEKPIGQSLRCNIADGAQTIGESIIASDIMIFTAKVSKVIIISDAFIQPIDFGKF